MVRSHNSELKRLIFSGECLGDIALVHDWPLHGKLIDGTGVCLGRQTGHHPEIPSASIVISKLPLHMKLSLGRSESIAPIRFLKNGDKEI